jgi:hypothetical protein
MSTPDPTAPAASPDVAEALAQAHDARTLAAALVHRLRADGKREDAATVEAIIVNPPNPGGANQVGET